MEHLTKRGYCRAPISDQSAIELQSLLGMYESKQPLAMPVLLDGKRFCSIKAAARSIGVCDAAVSKAISQNRRCKGHTVEYADF